MASILALNAIATTSSNQMNYSLSAQQAMQMENTKNQENLGLVVRNDILNVQNNALNPVNILELRSIDKITNTLNKISYSESSLVISSVDKQFTPTDFTESTFSGKEIMAITELGNVFTAVNFDDLAFIGVENGTENGKGNGIALLNGMGLNSRITQLDYFGKILHGQGIVGSQNSLKPYTVVSSTSNYAAELLNTDSKIIIQIPEFNTEYQYDDGNLQLIGDTAPNILSYSQSRTVMGNGISTQLSSGITFFGTGQIIVKLNDLGTQTLRLDGIVPSGAKLRFVENLGTHDLMTIPYDDTYGFNIETGSVYFSQDAYGTYSKSCTPPYPGAYVSPISYGVYRFSDSPNLDISSLSNFIARASGINFTPFGTQNSDSYTVESVNYSYGYSYCPQTGYVLSGPITPTPASGSKILYYDKNPVIDLLTFTTNFIGNTILTNIGKQYYLIAEPNGGTITVTGIVHAPSIPYLKITNIPPNIPYEIIKDEFVFASGMTPENGPLTLLLTDVDVKGTQGTAPTGTLYLYPDSLFYRGSLNTVVFDNVNGKTIHMPTVDDKIYVVHAYVQIPVTGSVTITNTTLNGGTLGMSLGELLLSYLNGNYENGDLIKVPVIPGYLNINMNINGIPTITMISNVLGSTSIKVANPATQTINDQDTDSALAFIESTTGISAYVVSTVTGNLNANFLAVISGSSTLTNTVTLATLPPLPPPVIRKDPLTGWIDIYKNGVLVQSIQLFFNDQPTFTSNNIVSGNSQIQTAAYSYSQTTISGTSVTIVAPGDMIEYYLYAKVHADGIPLIPPTGYVVSTVTSKGIATATIHSGSVITSS
ncbi:hypothetical protein DSQ19_07260 [Candidatus Nitrosotenuis sp. DW1]|nr:hypothetical protein DSQ19_07260 [Candidatus Nitrosotenuis sp. DW1]